LKVIIFISKIVCSNDWSWYWGRETLLILQ